MLGKFVAIRGGTTRRSAREMHLETGRNFNEAVCIKCHTRKFQPRDEVKF